MGRPILSCNLLSTRYDMAQETQKYQNPAQGKDQSKADS